MDRHLSPSTAITAVGLRKSFGDKTVLDGIDLGLGHDADAGRGRAPRAWPRCQPGSRALAEALPNAQLREYAGVSHNVKMNMLAPVLTELFAVVNDPASREDSA